MTQHQKLAVRSITFVGDIEDMFAVWTREVGAGGEDVPAGAVITTRQRGADLGRFGAANVAEARLE